MATIVSSLQNIVSSATGQGSFPGPGTYRIIDYQHPDMAVNCWGGGDGPEDVKLNSKSNDFPNSAFQFALVNASKGEYLIINSKNGLYLTGNPSSSGIRTSQSPPTNPKVRWTLEYRLSQGQYHTYFINCVDKSCGQLNIAGGGAGAGTQILSYPTENGENTLFYLDAK